MTSIWNILDEFRKNKYIIAVAMTLSLIFAAICYLNVKTYTAQIILKYNPDTRGAYILNTGTVVNPNDIKQPACVARAVEISGTDADMQSVIKSISVSKISPKSKSDSDTKNNAVSDTNGMPKYCKISVTTSKGEEYAELMLNSLINAYYDLCAEKCASPYMLNTADLPPVENYDYIEYADLIRGRIDNALNYSEILNNPETFRSTSTGYTFDELKRRFMFIRDNELSDVYAQIRQDRLSKNGAIISKKYNAKSVDAKSESEAKQLAASNASDYINANIDLELNRLQSGVDNGNAQSYDTLFAENVYEYVINSVDSIKLFYESEEYKNNADALSGECKRNDALQQKLVSIANQTDGLMNDLKKTSDDYQKYISADIVQCVTGVSTYSDASMSVVFSIFILVGAFICVSVILIKYDYKNNYKKRQHNN